MAKSIIKEQHISDNYDEYLDFLAKVKLLNSPFAVREAGNARKGRSPKSPNVKGRCALEASGVFGDTELHCEVKSDDNLKYSISLLCETLPSRTLSRFDSDGGDHRNRLPHIPLEFQSAPSPHLHYFDEKGYLIAAHVEFGNNSSASVAIDEGFDYFCKKLNISCPSGGAPKITVMRPPAIPFQINESDPHENVDFNH